MKTGDYFYAKALDTVTFVAHGYSDYGITSCVVDMQAYKVGQRTFPCGSGDDIILTTAMCRQIEQAAGLR